MSASERRALAPGIGVRAWRHFFAKFDLASRTSLHEGARVRDGRPEPIRPARPATSEELALLDGALHPDRPALEVFTTPALLRSHFEALDPDELPGGAAKGPSRAWSGFAQDVAGFLAHVQAPLAPPWALSVDVRDPEQAPALFGGGAGGSLLQSVPAHVASGTAPGAAAAHVNLGEVPSALVFWNVPLPGMASMLRTEGLDVPQDPRAIVARFAERFPACPVVRLALAPGEGVFVPFLLCAHDVDAAGAADLVVTLTAHPGIQSPGSRTPFPDRPA